MALDSWNWFIQLAQIGNFTRAADTLGISQQTLSARLASLEKELDAKLIARTTPLTLTPAGTEFWMFAKDQEQARTDMIRKVGDASSGGAGVLKVAISSSRACDLMPTVIKEFRKGLPGVRVIIMEGTNEELLRMAERGEVDIAGRIGQAAMKKAGIKYSGVVRSESMSVLLALCNEGLGAVFCPNALLDAFEQDNRRLARIHLTEPASYQISIGRPSNAEPWTPAQVFEDILGALYGE